MAPPPDGKKKNRRPVGAGLSLDKFANLGVSKFDKRKKLEQIKKQKLIQHSKYSKLKKKLEAQGVLAGYQVKDSVAELEALDGKGSQLPGEEQDEERVDSHARAGPGPQAQRGAQAGAAGAAAGRRPASGTPELAAPAPSSGAAQERSGHGKSQFSAHAEPQQGLGQKRQHAKGGEDTERQARPQKRPRDEGWQRSGGAGEEDAGEEGGGGGSRRYKDEKGGKKLSQLQRLAQKVAEEKAEKQRAKEEAMKAREERQQRIATVEKARKEQKHQYFKRNAKGQPLMRYRMDKLLSQIQKTA